MAFLIKVNPDSRSLGISISVPTSMPSLSADITNISVAVLPILLPSPWKEVSMISKPSLAQARELLTARPMLL